MDTAWFDPNTFGAWFGVIVGGGGGTLGGLLGGLSGVLSPQGKGRRFILGAMLIYIVLGVLLAATGIVALFTGQPYAIWYPFLLTGIIFSVVVGAVFPIVRNNYKAAENRKIAAKSMRVS